MFPRNTFLIALFIATASVASSQATPVASTEFRYGQNIADRIREASQADLAFIASGHLKESKDENLLSSLIFSSEDIWIVSLTGAQIRTALERSISFFPDRFVSFLHLSGAEVTFNPKKEATNRINSISLLAGNFDQAKSYNVAMPASLGRGGLGFYDIWEFKTPKSVVPTSLTKILEGKIVQPTTFRWLSKQSS
jgi:2',3'-cyclic-nucleotide 2'-phosphodiesterase (5'-nucleotidase family)